MLYALAGLFLTSFVGVFVKAFQQLNVTGDHKAWVMPTSLILALCQIYVITSVVMLGFNISVVLAAGLGGGFGCLASMITHKKVVGGDE